MKSTLIRSIELTRNIFLTTPTRWIQFAIVSAVAMIFVWMPQRTPIDWDLNLTGFWSNIPQTYLENPNFVYPPWGLILLLPYYLIRAAGARVLSVITIGWLTHNRKWPLLLFFAIVLSPYFLVTMAKSNMDILVIVFPILLWEFSAGKRWEIYARGISFSMMLLKPQCTFFILIYLLWISRNEWRKILAELAIVSILVIPISYIGSPPLIVQWLNNLTNPSSQNQFYWSINNISLTAKLGFWIAFGILSIAALIAILLRRAKVISWGKDQTISSLLLFSMYLLPYTSQQSLSSGLAFIPSWPGFLIQWLGVGIGLGTSAFYDNISLWVFSISFLSLLLYSYLKHRKEMKLQIRSGSDQPAQ